MSGHSKWSTIKHKKGATDAKRGKLFTKLIKEITIAARIGGGDPNGNPRLRSALIAARAANMPGDNVDRAVKRGTGELEGMTYEEITYEGYGQGGVALLVETVTDNRNRTVGEIRFIFQKYGGNMGETGSVSWMFEKRGVTVVDKEGVNEDQLMELALELGADDVKNDGNVFVVLCDMGSVGDVAEALRNKSYNVLSARVEMVPKNTIDVGAKDAESLMKLISAIEDNDDVQHVWGNYNIAEDVLESLVS